MVSNPSVSRCSCCSSPSRWAIFMARVFNREKTFMDPVLRPIERLIYRVTGVDEDHEMRWTEYAIAMLLFSVVSMMVLYLMRASAGVSAIQPAEVLAGLIPRTWHSTRPRRSPRIQTGRPIRGETTMSYFTQMAGLGVSQLCLGCDWDRPGDCVHSRRRAPPDARPSATSGWTWSAAACGCCCRSASWVRCCWFRRASCRI